MDQGKNQKNKIGAAKQDKIKYSDLFKSKIFLRSSLSNFPNTTLL